MNEIAEERTISFSEAVKLATTRNLKVIGLGDNAIIEDVPVRITKTSDIQGTGYVVYAKLFISKTLVRSEIKKIILSKGVPSSQDFNRINDEITDDLIHLYDAGIIYNIFQQAGQVTLSEISEKASSTWAFQIFPDFK